MTTLRQLARDRNWEKQFAPKITRRQVVTAVVVYAVWLGFLAFLAIDRWFGSLQ
jgi:hypothetical protein